MKFYFTFTISLILHFAAFSNDLCNEALSLNCGSTISLDTNTATHSDEFNGCSTESSNDFWYTFDGQDQWAFFSLISSTLDFIEIDIYEGSCGQFSNCNFLELSSFGSTSLSFWGISGTSYYVRIYSSSSQGMFEIKYECVDSASNDDCFDAQEISCLDDIISGNILSASAKQSLDLCEGGGIRDVWYTIIGDDNIHSFTKIGDEFDDDFSIQVYENVCDSDLSICAVTHNFRRQPYPFNFKADLGTTYLIRVLENADIIEGDFSFLYECAEPINNDDCDNSQPINCDEQILGDTRFGTTRYTRNGCNLEDDYDLWYEIQGDDMFHYLTLLHSSETGANVEVFKESCGIPQLECQKFLPFAIGHVNRFFAEANTTYYLRVFVTSFSNNNFGTFEFDHSCHPLATNDECSSPLLLNCPQVINGDTREGTFSDEFNNCHDEDEFDLWYEIIGNGNEHVFEFLNEDFFALEINIYQGMCGQFSECDTTLRLSSFGQDFASFQTNDGTRYKARISGRPSFNGSFQIGYSCGNIDIIESIPTLSQWGLILLSLLMLIIGTNSIKYSVSIEKLVSD